MSMGLAVASADPLLGPILAAILSIAAVRSTMTKGAGLLAVYSAGLAFPSCRGVDDRRFSKLFARMKGTARNVDVHGVFMVITASASSRACLRR